MSDPKQNKKLAEFLPSFLKNDEFNNGANETSNGMCFNSIYIPEEIILFILAYIEPKELLNYSLVCRKWNNLIKSYTLWSTIYKKMYKRRAKQLPWYVYYCLLTTTYFDTNLLLNGNGQDGFNNWQLGENSVREADWHIENPPIAADPLPLDEPEFRNSTSCFATRRGYKKQNVILGHCKLFQYILDNYKPHLYLSEWVAGIFGYTYTLNCGFILWKDVPPNSIHKPTLVRSRRGQQGRQSKWKKVDIMFTDYPEGIKGIVFEHFGYVANFFAFDDWRVGCKVTGGVVKFLFDTIEPLLTDEEGNDIPKGFSNVSFTIKDDEGMQYYYSILSSSNDYTKPLIMFHSNM